MAKNEQQINRFLKAKIVEHYGTQEQFAFETGIGESIISKIIRGFRKPTEHQTEIFEALLKTPRAELFRE